MDHQLEEIVLAQLQVLPVRDVLRVCATNKRFNEICLENQDYLYRGFIERDFGFLKGKQDLRSILNASGSMIGDVSHHPNLIHRVATLTSQVKHLLDYIDIDSKDSDGHTAFQLAIDDESPETCLKLLEFHPKLGDDDFNECVELDNRLALRILDLYTLDELRLWETIDFYRLLENSDKLVERVLDLDPPARLLNTSEQGTSVLSLAIINVFPDKVILKLLDLGADTGTPSEFGSPLLYAIEHDYSDKVIESIVSLTSAVNENTRQIARESITDERLLQKILDLPVLYGPTRWT